jgi:hypothetical protein
LLYAGNTVSAVTIDVDNYGETEVDQSSNLSADISPWTFGNLEIEPNDNVRIWFRLSWSDDRLVENPQAYHYFNITGDYDSGSQYDDEDYEKYTSGGDSGSWDINILFNNVQPWKYIDITLLANVTLSGKSAQDYDEHSIYLVNYI